MFGTLYQTDLLRTTVPPAPNISVSSPTTYESNYSVPGTISTTTGGSVPWIYIIFAAILVFFLTQDR